MGRRAAVLFKFQIFYNLMRWCLYVLLICIFAGRAYGQSQPIQIGSLNDAEQVALKNNLSLMIQKLDVNQAEKDILTASLRPNPQLSIVADVFPTSGQKFDPLSESYSASLWIPFELGGKRSYRIQTATALSKSAKLGLQNGIRLLLLSTRQAYYDVLAAQENVKIANTNYDSYVHLVKLNQTRLKSGQIPTSEFVRSQLALNQSELRRDEAELDLKKATETLGILLGQKNTWSVQDSLRQDSYVVTDFQRLLAQAKDRRSDVLVSKALYDAAQANQQLQDANGAIDIQLGLDFVSQQNNQYYGFSAIVPLPIFNRNQGEREKAAIKINQAERQIEAVNQQIDSELRTAYAEYQTRKAALEKFQKSGSDGILARAELVRHSVQFAYTRGEVSLLEVLDAVRIYSETFKSYIDALTLYNKSIATLKAVTGEDNTDFENSNK